MTRKSTTQPNTPRRRPDGSTPCATCPFAAANLGKPNPNGFDPKAAGEDFHDWYSPANIKRLWLGTAAGEVMLCHATDPNAANYGGTNAAPGNERPCTGALVLVLLHMRAVERATNEDTTGRVSSIRKTYRTVAGQHPLTKDGIVAWLQMMALGRTALFGGLTLPASLSPQAVRAVGVPWKDNLLEAEKEALRK